MKLDHKKLKRLAALQEIVYTRDAAQFQADITHVQALEVEIEDLRATLRTVPSSLGLDGSELMYWNNHRGWIEKRIRFLNQNLATARAVSAERRQQLLQSNGRRDVIKKLRGGD